MRDYDSLGLDWRVCQAMLFLNAVWDMLSTFSIWISYGSFSEVESGTNSNNNHDERNNNNKNETGDEEAATTESGCACCQSGMWLSIAEMHTSLWVVKEFSKCYATNILFGWWIFTLGWIRLFACFNRQYVPLAAMSYAIEGCFFLAESFKKTMLPKKSFYISVISFLCMLICVVKIPDSD
jgi:hypothetical protein